MTSASDQEGHRRPSVLVVNSNTSAAGTARIAAEVERYAGTRGRVTVRAAANGPEGIDTVLDLALAGVETVRVIAAERREHDAFVIACGNDPGLDAARQVTDRPVVGIAEAGMHVACLLGARFSIPVLGSAKVARMVDLTRHYGLDRQLASVIPLQTTTAAAIADGQGLLDGLIAAGRVARDRDLAEVLVLVGSAMSGLEDDISTELDIPVVCGLAAALELAGGLASLGLRTSHRYAYRTPPKQDRLHGYPELDALYTGAAATAGTGEED